MDEDEKDMLVIETGLLRKIHHPNIVKMYECYEDEDTLFIVMDIYKGGELLTEIYARNHLFKESEAQIFFKQLLATMNHCHKNGIMHRDLKP